jgi:hypothetical protein
MSDFARFDRHTKGDAPENLAFSDITRYRMANTERRFKVEQSKKISLAGAHGSLNVLWDYLLCNAA